MKKLIVGGDFGDISKTSSIVNKLAKSMDADIINGGTYEDLKNASSKMSSYDIVVWMPNIDNSYSDISINKKVGSTLIVSKAIRDHTRNRGDAVARIFKYHANAVIAIEYGYIFQFTLIDALNNDWAKSNNIEDIAKGIKDIYKWTNGAIREGTLRKKDNLDTLIEINKKVSQNVIEIQGRFFGNLSTRCASLFPSKREKEGYLVSGRNTDKKQLQRTDMVECIFEDNKIRYFGERKPSVDTPVQISIYEQLPNINYMIHGHNFIKNAPTTEHYFPCGDKREIEGIIELIGDSTHGVINLKNHGFLVYSSTLDEMKNICENMIIEEI